MNPLPGRPDGAAVDADGCYWVCGHDAGLDTLFVTSIRPEGVDLSDQPLAGGMYALRPGVRGLPEPLCLYC